MLPCTLRFPPITALLVIPSPPVDMIDPVVLLVELVVLVSLIKLSEPSVCVMTNNSLFFTRH